MKKRTFWQASAFIAWSALGFYCSCATLFPRNPEPELLMTKGAEIFKMTPTDRDNTGGTGFEVIGKSGNVYTVTNNHVCDIATNGLMNAWEDGNPRPHTLRVLEVSQTTDLCVLEGVPGARGSGLAGSFPKWSKLYAVGHPYLEPNTLSSGYIVDRQIIEVLDDDKDEAHCTGQKRTWQPVPTEMGEIPTCVTHIDAWESTIDTYPGNSGSPVFDGSGDVVGVLFASDRRTHRGSFIPLDALKDFLSAY